jgi:organic radical activating enzyme
MTGKHPLKRVVRASELPDGGGQIEVVELTDGRFAIRRTASRGNIVNVIDRREVYTNGVGGQERLTSETAGLVFDRIISGEQYSSCFVFHDGSVPKSLAKTDMEHRFTSTGIKFWRHQAQMLNYRDSKPGTVVSSHISPEGGCNLKCPYCSVTYRDTHSRIEFEVIQEYVEKCQSRGLRAVILTGGGEPTAYKKFNELVQWLHGRGLSVALITNGTLSSRVEDATWKCFSWVRVSVNLFDGWETAIKVPHTKMADDCVVGCSMVYTAEHEATLDADLNMIDTFKRVSSVADACGAKYVRLLPNCLLDQQSLLAQHASLESVLREVSDERFFQQHKVHGAPSASTCHQAYFRPYLSEEPYLEDGTPGSVYPCDSLVLNDSYQKFHSKYQLCRAVDILKFLDGELAQKFDPRVDCSGCVFTENVNMLDSWKAGEIDYTDEFDSPIIHEEFI